MNLLNVVLSMYFVDLMFGKILATISFQKKKINVFEENIKCIYFHNLLSGARKIDGFEFYCCCCMAKLTN